MNKKVCVIGGGNIGTYVAVYAKRKEYEVALYVGDETKFEKTTFRDYMSLSIVRYVLLHC